MRSAAIRLSEVREQINQGALDAMPKERLEALRKESISLEAEYRAEILNEESPERVELRSLYDGVELRSYLQASIDGTVVEGRAAELSQHLGLPVTQGRTILPYAALLAPSSRLEVRADMATTVSADAGGVEQDEILRRVFAQSATSFLGTQMKSLSYGEPNYVVFASGATAQNRANTVVKDAEPATFTPTTLEPLRMTARYLLNITDSMRVRGLEESMRADLNENLAEQMDKNSILGTGVAPEVEGFLTALTDPATAPSTEADIGDYVAAITGSVDGKYANMASQVKLLMGPQSYSHAAQTNLTVDSMSALQHVQNLSQGVQVSAHLPAPASDIQSAIAIAMSGHMGSVCPVWSGLEIIRDPYSAASTGQVALTIISLWNFKIIRSDAYQQVDFKLA